MPDVFKNTKNFISVNEEWLTRLKQEAQSSPKKLSRLCMHTSADDIVQEMILAFTKDCLIAPNSAFGKSESLTVIEGEMLLVLFNEEGTITDRIEMGPIGSNKAFMYRLCSASWHTMIPLSQCVIVHECIEGPFVKSEVSLPAWIPTETAELEKFLQQITQEKGSNV